MTLPPFKLERYFARYEFKTRYLLSPSDCEGLDMAYLLRLADAECRSMWENLTLSYTDSSGNPILRQEIASIYPGLNQDEVLVAVPEEAIFIAMHALLKPGDHVVFISPAYQSLYELAGSIGCSLTPWKVNATPSGWHLDIDRLKDCLTPQTRMVIINFPHNPTGYLASAGELDQVIELARQHGLYLFSDEMYRFLEYDPALRLPPVASIYEKGMSLSGLSKSLAAPGLRLGWLATRDKTVMEACQTYKDYTTICSSAPSEILGIIILRNLETILARNLAIISTNLRVAEAFFNRFEGYFTWLPPLAGSVAFPQWKGPIPVETFCQQLIERQGVMVVPGSIFDYPGDHFRVGLGRKNFAEALEKVGIFLEQSYES